MNEGEKMASTTMENSLVSTDLDMGENHLEAHDKQHKYLQDGEPKIEILTSNNLDDNSLDLGLKMAQSQGLKTEAEWQEYNDRQPKGRRKDNYWEYVKASGRNTYNNKKRQLSKITKNVKDEHGNVVGTRDHINPKSKREKIAQELAAIDHNRGLIIDGSLYYISNTMQYDQMAPDELKKYRQFERKTLTDFYNSKTFKELNPGLFRAELHYDETGAIHLQTQSTWYHKDGLGRVSFAKRKLIKELLVKRYGSEEKLNDALDVLCHFHSQLEDTVKPGSDSRIGSPTISYYYWQFANSNSNLALSDKVRTDKHGKVWPHKYTKAERDTRLVELWRMEQMKTLGEIALQNANQMGVNWTLDTTYTTDGRHRSGQGYVQHKKDMNEVNTEVVAQQRKANQLKQSNTKAQTDLKATQEQSKKAVDALNAQRSTWTANQKVLAKQRQQLVDAEKVRKAQQAMQEHLDQQKAKQDKVAKQQAERQAELDAYANQLKSQQQSINEQQDKLNDTLNEIKTDFIGWLHKNGHDVIADMVKKVFNRLVTLRQQKQQRILDNATEQQADQLAERFVAETKQADTMAPVLHEERKPEPYRNIVNHAYNAELPARRMKRQQEGRPLTLSEQIDREIIEADKKRKAEEANKPKDDGKDNDDGFTL